MRTMKPVVAFLCLSLLNGCGGGGSKTGTSTIGTPTSTGSGSIITPVSVATPIVSPTFTQSNAGPGVQAGATQTGGTGSADATSATVTSIVVSPSVASLEVNRRLTLTALGKDKSGNPVVVPDENWQWSSSDPSVAVLTSQGATATISGVKAGTVIITALEGASKVKAQVSLTIVAVGGSSGSAPGGSGLGDGSTGGSGTGSTGGTGGSGTGGTGGTGGSGTGGTGGTTGSTVVYANDFANGAGPEWSNTRTETTPGTAQHAPTPFLGEFGPDTVQLSLKDLTTHTSATIEFDLFIIRSMDGNSTISGLGPDIWNLSVAGGPTLLNTTFSSITSGLASSFAGFSQGFFQAFPDTYPGGQHPYQTGAAEANTLGFVIANAGVYDAVYHLKYTFPHTAATVAFNFTSKQTQDVTDESWGLKNVKLTLNP